MAKKKRAKGAEGAAPRGPEHDTPGGFEGAPPGGPESAAPRVPNARPIEEPEANAPRGAEGPRDEDIHVRGIFLFMLGIFGLLGVAVAVTWGISGFFHKRLQAEDPPPSPMPEANAPVLPPGPRLRENPAADMDAVRAREKALLESYGWVEKESGVARIPIERALELAAQGKTAAKTDAPDGGTP